MKKLFSNMHEHLLKHPCKYLGLAAFCKVMLLGLLSIPLLQTIQHTYAGWWTITATAGAGGTITPSWAIYVGHLADQSFTITPNAWYNIKNVSVDSISQWAIPFYTFTTVISDHTITAEFRQPPIVSTSSASAITSSSATLNGTLTSLGTASSVDVYFEWGPTAGYGNTTSTQPMTTTGSFSGSITGLTPSMTYHFRTVANGGSAGTAYGGDMTFPTNAAPTGWVHHHNGDNCCLYSNSTQNLPGANRDCRDFSPSPYDKDCRPQEEIECAKDIPLCLDLTGKVQQLIDLNNLFTNWVTTTTTTQKVTQDNSLYSFLKYFANQLSKLNNSLIQNLTK